MPRCNVWAKLVRRRRAGGVGAGFWGKGPLSRMALTLRKIVGRGKGTARPARANSLQIDPGSSLALRRRPHGSTDKHWSAEAQSGPHAVRAADRSENQPASERSVSCRSPDVRMIIRRHANKAVAQGLHHKSYLLELGNPCRPHAHGFGED